MAQRLVTSDPEFDQQLNDLLSRDREIRIGDANVPAIVAEIIADVRARGDAALNDYTLRFDRFNISEHGLQFSEAEIEAAISEVSDELKAALQTAADRIRVYHESSFPLTKSGSIRPG